ncbi:MAG: hypothetical protein J5501_01200 [Ruminococcus sp.]|nr:hypothetical protein [Ruminococcus sp.]
MAKNKKRTGTFRTILLMIIVTLISLTGAALHAGLSTGYITANYTTRDMLSALLDRDRTAPLFTIVNSSDQRYPSLHSAFRTSLGRNLLYLCLFFGVAMVIYLLITLIADWISSAAGKRKPAAKNTNAQNTQVRPAVPPQPQQPYQAPPVSPYAPQQGYPGYAPQSPYAQPGGYVPPQPVAPAPAAPAAAPKTPETVAAGSSSTGSRGAKTMKLRREAIAERAAASAAAAVPAPEPVIPEPEDTGIAAFLRHASIIVYTDIQENGRLVRYYMANTVPDIDGKDFQNDKIRQFMQFNHRNTIFAASDGSGRLRTDLRFPKNLRLQYSEEYEVFQLACGERAISADNTAAVQSVDLVYYEENEAYRDKYVRDVTMCDRDYHIEIAY